MSDERLCCVRCGHSVTKPTEHFVGFRESDGRIVWSCPDPDHEEKVK